MVIPNMDKKFQNVDIFCNIVCLPSAHACRRIVVNHILSPFIVLDYTNPDAYSFLDQDFGKLSTQILLASRAYKGKGKSSNINWCIFI